MKLVGASRPVVVEICWHCSGTGHRLVSASPFRFRTCPICYGRRGRQAARHEFSSQQDNAQHNGGEAALKADGRSLQRNMAG